MREFIYEIKLLYEKEALPVPDLQTTPPRKHFKTCVDWALDGFSIQMDDKGEGFIDGTDFMNTNKHTE